MTEALANHERIVDNWRRSWYYRVDDCRKQILEKKEGYETSKARYRR